MNRRYTILIFFEFFYAKTQTESLNIKETDLPFNKWLVKEKLEDISWRTMQMICDTKKNVNKESRVAKMSEDDMREVCKAKLSSSFLYDDILKHIPVNAMKGITTKECLLNMPTTQGKRILDGLNPAHIEKIAASVFVNMDEIEMRQLGKGIKHVDNIVWKDILYKTQCHGISACSLEGMSKEKLIEVTPTCLANMSDLRFNKMDPFSVSNLKDDVFSEIKGKLSNGFYRGMTKEQVRRYGENSINSDMGGYLDLKELSLDVLSEVKPSQFSRFLEKSESTVQLSGECVKRLRDDILEKCCIVELKKIDPSSLYFFGSRLNRINPNDCSIFTPSSNVHKLKSFYPTGKCISAFNPDFLCAYLVNNRKKLYGDALSYITKENILGLTCQGVDGLHVFDKIGFPDEVLQRVGDNVLRDNHPCTLIETKKELIGYKWHTKIGGSCLNALSLADGLTSADLEEIPVETISKMHFSELARFGVLDSKAGRWRRSDISLFISNSGEFCSKIDYTIFKRLKPETYQEFDPVCVSKLEFLWYLTQEETKRMRDDAFKLLSNESRIDVSVLTDKQLSSLSIESGSSVCERIDSVMLKKLEKRINRLPGKCIEVIPGRSWEEITKAQVQSFGNTILDHLTSQALENIPEESVKSLSGRAVRILAQKSKIENHNSHPCRYLVNNTEKFWYFGRRRISGGCKEYV